MIDPLRPEYTIDDIEDQANRVADVVERVRNSIFSPDYIKKPLLSRSRNWLLFAASIAAL